VENFRFDVEKFISLTDTDKFNLVLLEMFENFKWFKYKDSLGSGDVVGERALVINDFNNNYWKQQVIANCYCEFALVNRDDYLRVIRKIQTNMLQEKLEYMRKLPFFMNLSTNNLKRIGHFFKYEKFKRNHFIFKQYDTP